MPDEKYSPDTYPHRTFAIANFLIKPYFLTSSDEQSIVRIGPAISNDSNDWLVPGHFGGPPFNETKEAKKLGHLSRGMMSCYCLVTKSHNRPQ